MNPLLVSMLPSCPLCGEGWEIAGARVEPKCNHWPEVNRKLARSLAARFDRDIKEVQP